MSGRKHNSLAIAMLHAARTDRSGEPSRDRHLGNVAAATSLGLAFASNKAALVLEAQLAVAALTVGGAGSMGAVVTKAAVVGGVVGALSGLAGDTSPEGGALFELGDVAPRQIAAQRGTPLGSPSKPGGEAGAPSPGEGARDDGGSRSNAAAPAHGLTEASMASKQVHPHPVSSNEPSRDTALPAAVVSAAAASADEQQNGDFARAVAQLERAQRALRDGQPGTALEALKQYDKASAAALAPEARILLIRARLSSGQVAEGRRQARAWLQREPHGPYASRLRALLNKTHR